MHYYFISIFIELPRGSFHGGERCCTAFLEVIVGFDMTSLKLLGAGGIDWCITILFLFLLNYPAGAFMEERGAVRLFWK